MTKRGVMHAVWNNLAQHANTTQDMHLSIEYLEKAIEVAEDPQVSEFEAYLPVSETILNLANAHCFFERFDKGLF